MPLSEPYLELHPFADTDAGVDPPTVPIWQYRPDITNDVGIEAFQTSNISTTSRLDVVIGGYYKTYILAAGSASLGTDLAPDDYDVVTNDVHWALLLVTVTPGNFGTLLAAANTWTNNNTFSDPTKTVLIGASSVPDISALFPNVSAGAQLLISTRAADTKIPFAVVGPYRVGSSGDRYTFEVFQDGHLYNNAYFQLDGLAGSGAAAGMLSINADVPTALSLYTGTEGDPLINLDGGTLIEGFGIPNNNGQVKEAFRVNSRGVLRLTNYLGATGPTNCQIPQLILRDTAASSTFPLVAGSLRQFNGALYVGTYTNSNNAQGSELQITPGVVQVNGTLTATHNSGSVSDSLLSANIPRKDQANTFSNSMVWSGVANSDPSIAISSVSVADWRFAVGSSLRLGGMGGTPYGIWLQTYNINTGASTYPIFLNPLGGGVSIGFGTANPPTALTVGETTTASPRGIMSWQSNAGTDGARLHLRKSRGTFTTPLMIVTGDHLGKMVTSGYDGTNYLEIGSILVTSTGTVATNRIPTQMVFSTATNAAPSVLTTAMTIDEGQNVILAHPLGVAQGGTSFSSLDAGIIDFLGGAGAGVTTALNIDVGSAGAFVINGGAGGTPSSLVLTNATGLPTGSITSLSALVSFGTGSVSALFNSTGLLQFAGATSSFPALKRSSTVLQARLADDSAFAPLQAKLTTDTAATTGLTAGVLAALTTASIVVYDSTGQAYRVPCIV